MRILTILLLQIFVIAHTTNGQQKKTPARNTNINFAPRYDFTSENVRISNLVANGVLSLGMNIFRHTTSDSDEKIQVISPLSIAGVSALIELGSMERTLEELLGIREQAKYRLSFIEYHDRLGQLINQSTSWSNEKHKITVSNGIFMSQKYTIRGKYTKAAKLVYKSKILKMDFENQSKHCATLINNWVNQTTSGKIKEIVSNIEPSTQSILVSTLYFKALWDNEVGVQQVLREQFYPNGLEQPSIKADMLFIEGGKYLHHQSSKFDCSLIGLNYDKGASTMFIILPNNSTKEKNLKLLNTLKSEDIENMIQTATYKSATILLPKFHVEQTVDIKTALQKMGLNTVFDPKQSDLSMLTYHPPIKMPKNQSQSPTVKALDTLVRTRTAIELNRELNSLYVNNIVHKIVLTVDEIGTEGGAATGTVINKSGSSVLFLAQSPFLFLIRHTNTKLPLFYGAVFEPSFNKKV